jgi:hypothetical protein
MTAALAALTGCHHRTQVAAVTLPAPPPAGSVPLLPAPQAENPPQLKTVPVPPVPLPSQPVQPKPRKPKRKVEPPPAQPAAPVQVAVNEPPPAAAVIGSLTEGGEEAPQEQHKAEDAIVEVEKRLAGVSAGTLESQKGGVTRVRSFLRQAREALKTGDADGALTLATKAKVLLDDLLK